MLEVDADAKAMLKEAGGLPMPNQNLSDTEVRQYIKYFKWADEQNATGEHDAKEGKR
jgi:nitrite reductase (NO-forming)